MVHVLRLGHRPGRDKRISTHVSLTARAMGASGITFSTSDENLFKSVRGVVERFGGNFSIDQLDGWRTFAKKWPGKVVHLTMYGEPLSVLQGEMPWDEEPLVIVGAEKVPRETYDIADYNVAVGNQPHSEVAALALFLDRYHGGEWERKDFDGANEILPRKSGKTYASEVSKGLKREECIELLKKSNCSKSVIRHVEEVERRSLRWGAMAGADLDLLRQGALLHDIGRGKTHGIDHGVVGYQMLKEMGVEEEICRFALVHVGAGLGREEAKKHGLGKLSLIPVSLEEKIVTHADNLTKGDKPGTLAAVLKDLMAKEACEGVKRMLELHLEMEVLLGGPPECL